MKKEIRRDKIIYLTHGDYQYPITLQLIKDGKKNKILNKRIYQNLKVTMVHGSKDEVVPVKYSRMVLKTFPVADKKLLIITNGDHSLSSNKHLSIICKELQKTIKKIN